MTPPLEIPSSPDLLSSDSSASPEIPVPAEVRSRSSLIELLEAGEAIRESADEITPERLELARKAFMLKLKGFTFPEIAEELGLSRSTVIRILNDYRAAFAKALAGTPVAHLISQELLRLEANEELMKRKATTFERVNPKISVGYERIAHQIARTRIELLMNCGLIPREPTKIYQVIESAPTKRDEERTPEEIKDSIMQLLKRGRKLI